MNDLRITRASRLGTDRQFQIYVVIEGSGSLQPRGGVEIELAPGDTWLVPAATGYHDVAPSGDELGLLQLVAIP